MKFQVLERLHLNVLIITFIYLLVSVSTGDVCTSLDIHVETRGHCVASLLSFYHVCPEGGTQVIRLGDRYPHD